MLREHLSQDHDLASRRLEVIDLQVKWIHEELLAGREGSVLDLGCGPGLYTNRLARLGHRCTGIDISPASVAYATEHADGLDCQYSLADIREAAYGSGHELVMLLYGELNAFSRADAVVIVERTWESLRAGGLLLLEVHPFEAVRAAGSRPHSWYASECGLFSDEPHICLREHGWHSGQRVATIRYHIIDATQESVETISEERQAYSTDEYSALLTGAGFREIEFFSALPGLPPEKPADLVGIIARKG
jgi:SAM-dependent methyltransferase